MDIAKGAVGRSVDGNGVGFQHAAIGRKDIDHRAGAAILPASGGDDIALNVEAHAVDATVGVEVVQDLVFTHRTVVVDRVGAQFALLVLAIFTLRDVEPLHVSRDKQTVGLGRVKRHAVDR